MRLKDPLTTANFFSSGKVLVLGAKNESSARLACRKYTRIVRKLGFEDAKFSDFKIVNIVSTAKLPFRVSLEEFSISEHSISIRYEPEIFSGIIYKMLDPKVTILIYATGRIVLLGAKNDDQVNKAAENIYAVLHNFKKL
jgi:transcription initiation factor TFIID TATA-box-binding protein